MPPASNPVFASVAVLRVPDFSQRSVTEQAALKESLERVARGALDKIPVDARAVLDADDGLAIVVFGDPTQALQLAQAVAAAGSGVQVQAGLNHGPLALTSRNSDARVFGDGLAAAFAAARFASPGQVLVTRDFAQMLGRRNPARAAELASAGEFTDTQVRQHTFYTPDARRGARHRRNVLMYGIAGVLAILVLGLGAREAKIRLTPPAPAVLVFQVKPRGEVVLDGMVRGRVPALTELEVAPGKHVLRIHNAGSPAFETMLELQPGERRTITHTFVAPRKVEPRKVEPRKVEPRKSEPPPEPDFWRDLKKMFS